MSKELEALERLYKCNDDDYTLGYQQHDYKLLHQALQRLESIDNAKPSKALEGLENLGTNGIEYREPFELGFTKSMPFKSTREFKIIKQALIKAQEQEKVLEIIIEKGVDVATFNTYQTVIEYNWSIRFEKHKRKELTQEEFELLMEWLG